MQRKQKTSNEGWPAKNRVEPKGMQEVRAYLRRPRTEETAATSIPVTCLKEL